MDDFPVLKAFQQYIDSEQAKARKRMLMLCAFFGFLMIVVIGVFVVLLVNVSARNQALNDRLIEFAMKERDQSKSAPLSLKKRQPRQLPRPPRRLKPRDGGSNRPLRQQQRLPQPRPQSRRDRRRRRRKSLVSRPNLRPSGRVPQKPRRSSARPSSRPIDASIIRSSTSRKRSLSRSPLLTTRWMTWGQLSILTRMTRCRVNARRFATSLQGLLLLRLSRGPGNSRQRRFLSLLLHHNLPSRKRNRTYRNNVRRPIQSPSRSREPAPNGAFRLSKLLVLS